MIKETTLEFSSLTDDIALFKKDFSLNTHEEESDDGDSLYVADLQHSGLGFSQSIRESNENILTFKTQQVLNQWIHTWNQKSAIGSKQDKISKFREVWANLLSSGLDKKHALELDKLKNKEPFEFSTTFGELQSKLDSIYIPTQPKSSSPPPKPEYTEPVISFSEKLLLKKKGILDRYEKTYNLKLETWQKICEKVQKNHLEKQAEYEEILRQVEREKLAIRQQMDSIRIKYEEERLSKNEGIDILQINYQSKQPEAVEQYFELVLMQSELPESFPRQTELEYHRENNSLFVSMELPHPVLIPNEKEMIFNTAEQKEEIILLTKEEFSLLYNEIIYKTILRTIHEIFSADEAEAVDAIHFKGWVKTLNRGNGQFENTHIVSIFTSRNEFKKINLRQIEPTLCFRFLKGISAPLLTELTEIPIPFTIRKKYQEESAMNKIQEPNDNGTNIANLGWRDFENLIVELIQKEFGSNDCEIKILNSKLETGLEALGQDPDLIRGGKILFHAIRSIKPITLSPVRELFGSVIHEGALKGILLTTADFTTEAYEFVKNKPISLLNGTHLLALFEKHGHKLRINLREPISLETWLS